MSMFLCGIHVFLLRVVVFFFADLLSFFEMQNTNQTFKAAKESSLTDPFPPYDSVMGFEISCFRVSPNFLAANILRTTTVLL